MKTIITGLGFFTAFIGLLAIIAVVISYPVMWLWNSCLVELVDGIHPLGGFWQTLGLIVLCGILFKSSSSSSSSK